jgi:MFS family permease
MVASLTHASVRPTAMGTLTLSNNLLGLALGPFVVGVLADRLGLLSALQFAPVVYLPAIAVLLLGRRLHPSGVRRLQAVTATTTP